MLRFLICYSDRCSEWTHGTDVNGFTLFCGVSKNFKAFKWYKFLLISGRLRNSLSPSFGISGRFVLVPGDSGG
ncbi:hypothetical protein HanIR_Chr11g0524141 [Helianthus annuus]|nr:hypothetical protein HanIR_Chr11g0524141 [Helianthus annuus]